MKKEPNFSRRVLIYAVMAFCMAMIVWLAWNGEQSGELHKLIAEGCFYLMGFVTFFYVLGQSADLVALAKFMPGPIGMASRAGEVAAPRRRDRAESYMGPP